MQFVLYRQVLVFYRYCCLSICLCILFRVFSDPAKVADDLRKLRFRIKEAVRLFTLRGLRKPLSLIRFTLLKEEVADQLLNMTSLCGIKLKIERNFEASHNPECHRCQPVGHGFDKTVACVMCRQRHSTSACKLTPGTDRIPLIAAVGIRRITGAVLSISNNAS